MDLFSFFFQHFHNNEINSNIIGIFAIFTGIIIPFLVFGGLFYWIFNFQKKRQRQLKKVAKELGLFYGYSSEEGERIYSEIKNFDIFKRGILPQIWHIIQGKWKGVPITVFDYRFKEGLPIQYIRLRYQTIVYVKLKNKNYKKRKIRKEGYIIELEGNKVIYYKESKYIKPEELRDFLNEAIEDILKL